jgi:uncharacterized protein
MRIGVMTLEIEIPGNQSLKGKRSVIRSLKDRIRNGFNVSIAEVEAQDEWQRAVLGIVCVGAEQKVLNGQLNRIRDLVDCVSRVELLNCEIDFI